MYNDVVRLVTNSILDNRSCGKHFVVASEIVENCNNGILEDAEKESLQEDIRSSIETLKFGLGALYPFQNEQDYDHFVSEVSEQVYDAILDRILDYEDKDRTIVFKAQFKSAAAFNRFEDQVEQLEEHSGTIWFWCGDEENPLEILKIGAEGDVIQEQECRIGDVCLYQRQRPFRYEIVEENHELFIQIRRFSTKEAFESEKVKDKLKDYIILN